MAEARPLILLDGATGTELTRRGVDTHGPAWSAPAIIHAPATLAAIHEDNARAGADVITANTFRTQRRALSRIGQGRRAREWTAVAVQIARDAARRVIDESADGRVIRVAGSVAPLEDSYTPAAAPDESTALREHREHVENLTDADVDLLLVETMTTIAESRAATHAATETGIETWTSVTLDPAGDKLISGEPFADWVDAVTPLRPAALLVNCVAPEIVRTAMTSLVQLAEPLGALPGAYANLGSAEPLPGGGFDIAMTPEAYAEATRPLLDAGARIVGGCCGTTPDHIGALRTLLDERLAAEHEMEGDPAWRALVGRAATIAGGGRAVVVGDHEPSGTSVPERYAITHVTAADLASLPGAAFRLALLDSVPRSLPRVARTLEPGGWLAARLAVDGPPPEARALELGDLELREYESSGERALLLARRPE